MIPTPPNEFDEWMRLPVTPTRPDSPYEVRRAEVQDFERVYDVVDAAFGKRRPRKVYDWMYRLNPMGTAQCWIVIERASGMMIKTGASFPWPIWHGDQALRGAIGADAATHPDWQRKGLSAIRLKVRRSHPWRHEICGISGPNLGSRTVMQKRGDGAGIMGRLRGAVAPLVSSDLILTAGMPGAIARPMGRLGDAALNLLRNQNGPDSDATQGQSVEVIGRFTTDYDDVTKRCMAFSRFWCPHNAAFLNWRYLDHPGETYVGLALVEDERPVGYAMLLLDGKKATLSEFAVAPSPKSGAHRLLRESMAVAREAGCVHLNFFATRSWRHWGLFYRFGFIPYPSPNYFEASLRRYEPEVFDSRNWQVMPGDRDYH